MGGRLIGVSGIGIGVDVGIKVVGDGDGLWIVR